MGLKINKKINLGGGVSLNVGKTGVSVSKKVGNTTVNVNKDGRVKGTVSAPGTGVSYSKTLKKGKKK